MKKILYILSFVELFILASCYNEPIPDTSSSNTTTESIPNNNQITSQVEDSETKDNPNNNDNEEKITDTTSPIGDYDDGGDWHGKVD